jgi:hypothetical protein
MRAKSSTDEPERLVAELSRLWKDEHDRILLTGAIHGLDTRYKLKNKIVNEPGVEDIVKQMFRRLANSFGSLSNLRGKMILDIACGSSTSRTPAMPFGAMTIGHSKDGYTAMFEPWFCRILCEMEANAVGIDVGDLEHEPFTHYRVDLGQIGALNFLPDRSFDAVQDSRLFGSPEFTTQFPHLSDHLKIAQEIRHQERRLLKTDGIVIHSDAEALLR